MNDKDEETSQAVEDMPETSESEIEPLTSGEMTLKPDDEVTLEEESPENDTIETTPEPVPVQEIEPEPEPESEPEVKTKPKPESAPKPTPPKEVQKEVVIIREVEKKQPNNFMKKIKRSFLAVILIIALVIAGGIYAWTSGMDDLRDDNDYLIVLVYKDVAKAGSIYHTDMRQSEVVEVTELGDITNRKQFFIIAQQEYGVLDRMVIIDVDTLVLLSPDSDIEYETGDKIERDKMSDWLTGLKIPPEKIIGEDESMSIVRAKILKAWIDHYSDQLLSGYGSYTIKVVLNAYRADDILIYPGNSALTILKYVAVEKLVFPV
ncbi:MAG: hypothetical protein C5S43_04565 [Candidatus Methanocomedens sp.]|nr:MAG: hypothetical protein C5S43_04565 [ANME-2 cluster archaeon]